MTKMTKWKWTALSAPTLIMIAIVVGCGGDDTNIPPPGQDGDIPDQGSGHDGSGGDAHPDGGSIADSSGTDTSVNDSGSEAGTDGAVLPDSGVLDAGQDAGSLAAPVITILTPLSGATINCKTTSTYNYSAQVIFGAPMQSVRFDYLNIATNNLALTQQKTFVVYANPFVQTVDLGNGNVGALCTLPKSIGKWKFIVTATDTTNPAVVASIPFNLIYQ